MGDDGHDSGPRAEGEADEAGAPVEVDPVALRPGPAGLPVPAGVDEHGGVLSQGLLGGLTAGGQGPEPADHRLDARDREQEVVAEAERRGVESAPAHQGDGGDPHVRHVEQSGVVPDDEHGAGRGKPLRVAHLRSEVPHRRFDGRELAADELDVPSGRPHLARCGGATLEHLQRCAGHTLGCISDHVHVGSSPGHRRGREGR